MEFLLVATRNLKNSASEPSKPGADGSGSEVEPWTQIQP